MAQVREVSAGGDPGAVDVPDMEPPVNGLRPGGQALTILATPLNSLILQALSEQPMRLAELRRATGLPAQTTLRGHLASLGEMGVLAKRPIERTPYAVESSLTPMGRELLEVAESLARWLDRSPSGPTSLESGAGKGIVKALVDGWGSTIFRNLGSTPMSLTELDRKIPSLSYPALERRLSSMRMAGLIEACESSGAGTPYGVTNWARRGIAPLMMASKCEQAHMASGAAPITPDDIEAAFLLATPLVGVSTSTSGTCQLEVEAEPTDARDHVGVSVTVDRGRVVACDSQIDPAPGDFAVGSVAKWFSAIREGTASLLRFGGRRRVAESVVIGLHAAMVMQ